MSNSIQKPKYVRKYDYLRSFYRPENHWFWPTVLIDEKINDLIKQYYKTDISNDDIESEEQELEYDPLDTFKELKGDLEVSKVLDMDDNDPKVIQGKIIDQASKEFIKDYFDLKTIDLEKQYKFNSNEQNANITIELLKQNDNLVLFQPTFIAKNIAIAKPDALIKKENIFTLVEVKSSTSPKSIHTLDMIYQTKVVNEVLKNNGFKIISDYKLCLVSNEKGQKNTVDFYLTNLAPHQKGGSDKEENMLTFQELFDPTLMNSSEKKKQKIIKDAQGTFANIWNDRLFWSRIDTIKNTQVSNDLDFSPTKAFRSEFKDHDSLKSIREFYRCSNLYLYTGFSGNLIKIEEQFNLSKKLSNVAKQQVGIINDFKSYAEKISNNFIRYYETINQNPNTKYVFSNKTKEYLDSNLKSKKVYFDFESINLAIRPIDDCTAYMQIINQVSIITDHNDGTAVNKLKSNNIIKDPKTISLQDFKDIINAILKDIKNPNEYSFVVYNAGFERSCLKKMAELINEPLYDRKVENITNNIFDLANLFDIRKDYCTYIWELKGFYSIKYVLNMIEKDSPKIFNLTGCKNYKTLNIQNGGQAQSRSTLRFFDKVNDVQWAKDILSLKEYCENDVRAMIALEYWIKEKIKEQENGK